MADPLDLLRECILNNLDIREEEDQVYLGDTLLPKSTVTSFKCSKKGEIPQECYTLDSLLFFLKNNSLPHVVYHTKAKKAGIQFVKRYDRKRLLKLLTGSSENSTEVTPVESKRRNSSSSESGQPPKKKRTDDTETQIETPADPEPVASKFSDDAHPTDFPTVEPVQRNEYCDGYQSASSIDDPRSPSIPSPTPSSIANTVDTGTQTEPDNQAATIQAFQVISNRVLKFMQDELGLSRDEQEAVLEGKKVNLRRNLTRGKQPRCFVAIPHPLFEWDTVKEEATHIVSGQRINRKSSDIETRYQFVLDNCLKRGESDLKDSLSILISHMRDLNKSSLAAADIEASCKRTLEKCLTSAQEDFREMFESLLSVVHESNPDLEVQRWVSESETELRKLLNSLMLSLQTLRDVSPASRTLFHFPEPIVSIALNPTKVTHSVVLEIYVRLGLAELRRILIDMISAIEKARAGKKGKPRQPDSGEANHPEDADDPEVVDPLERPHSASSFSDRGRSTESPSFASSMLVESIKNDWSADEADSSSTLRTEPKNLTVRETFAPLLNDKEPLIEPSAVQVPTPSKPGNADKYSEFKDSIKSTLVTSFKKRIQEKIEASATTEECISWLRTKKGFRNVK